MLVSSDGLSSGDCSGTSTTAMHADDLYEAGVALFLLAGNSGESGNVDNCTVWSPGDAIGVFTVGGYDSNDDALTLCDLRSSDVDYRSSWGGSTTTFNEGRYRSIIDIAGAFKGSEVPVWQSDTFVSTFLGTSHATPSVASVAVDVIDMFKNYRQTDFIDDPGVLYAWMLNMADRTQQGGAKLTTRFDHRLGAGKVNARFIGSPGMDAPWFFAHYELCIGHNEVHTITFDNVSSDIDSLRAVAWWYDRRLETQPLIDDVDLALKESVGTPIAASDDAYDNKERIYSDAVGGKSVKLEVIGYNVTSDGEGCGTNAMRVYVTILAEDDDRDDGDGPSYDAITCEGVQTL
jgi:hypothetical protein